MNSPFNLTPYHIICENEAQYDGKDFYCDVCNCIFSEDELGLKLEELTELKALIDSGVVEIPQDPDIN